MQLKCKKRFVYGEGAVTDQTCQKWFAKKPLEICAGDFSLDDTPWWGRSVEVDKDQIETIIESNQCYTTWGRANTLKISKSSAENHLQSLVMLITLMFDV